MSPCLTHELLEQLALGRVSPAARSAAESHLDSCPACHVVVSELLRLFGSSLQATVLATSVPVASPALADTVAVQQQDLGGAPGRLGRYVLRQRLGEGAMGAVFSAFDSDLQREVAIKLLHPDPYGDAERQRAQVFHEARAMAQLHHPNVVSVYDVGQDGPHVYIAFELVRGTTLRGFLESHPTLPRAAIIELFVQAGRGLEAAHQVGLVHRDFKPENVLVGLDQRARVTDFGIARRLGITSGTQAKGPSLFATEAGALIGTPAYMAPEQLRRQPADASSDQFSFCVALYEAIFQRRPFGGETLGELAIHVVGGDLRPPDSSAPAWLRKLLIRGLATRQVNRYPHMTALLAELSKDRRRPWWPYAIGATVLSSTAVTIAVLTSNSAKVGDKTSANMAAEANVGESKNTGEKGETKSNKAAFCLRDDFAERFSDERKKALSVALQSKLSTDGTKAAERFTTEIRGYETRFRLATELACSAEKQRVSAEVETCFDDRLSTLESLVATLRVRLDAADHVSSWRLLDGVARLPLPSLCLDSRFVANAFSNPQAAKLVSALAELRALGVSNVMDDGITAAKNLVRKAKSAGDLVYFDVEARLVQGALLREHGDFVEAEQIFDGAASDAQAGRLLPSAYFIGLAWLDVLSRDLGDPSMLTMRLVEKARPILPEKAPTVDHNVISRSIEIRKVDAMVAEGRLPDAAEYIDKYFDRPNTNPSDDVELVFAKSEIHLALKQPKEALEEVGKVAFGAKKGTFDPFAEAYSAILSARAHNLAGRFPQARLLAKAARSRFLDFAKLYDERLAQLEDEIAFAYAGEGDIEAALKSANGAFATRRMTRDDAPYVFRSHLTRAKLYFDQKKYTETLESTGKAIAAIEQRAGNKSSQLVAPLLIEGAAFCGRKDKSKAIDAFSRAEGIVKDAYDVVAPRLGEVESQKGRCLYELGDDKAALKLLDDAFIMLTSLYGLSHPRVTDDTILRGDLAKKLGETARARELWNAVLPGLSEKLGATHPSVVALRDKLGR